MATDADKLSRLERLIGRVRGLLSNVRQGAADLESRRKLAQGDPKLVSRIDDLISRAGYVERLANAAEYSLSTVQTALRSIGEWWDDLWGSNLDGLGVAPVVAIPAAIAAATVAISAATAWISDYQEAARRLDFIESRMNEGSTLEEAQRAANGAASGFAEWATVAKFGVGAVSLIAAAKLIEATK